MKKIAVSFAASVLALGLLAGCGSSNNAAPAPKADATSADAAPKAVTLKIGATPVPHAEILNFIKPLAAKEGLNLDIVVFNDYVQPNMAVQQKQLDANYFQHVPYLTTFNKEHNTDLVSVGTVHLEPLGLYSLKVKDVKSIKDGATITIPNDTSNGGRALNLLAQNGLIKLKDGAGILATVNDIAENPHKLVIKAIAPEQLPRTLNDVDAAVINSNYYLEAQKNAKLDANLLARESAQNNPYANVIAVRKGDENRPEIQKLVKLLQSPEVKQFIEKQYNGAVIPAF